MIPPSPDEARNLLIQIVTSARAGDINTAVRLANEYKLLHGDILPLFISAISLVSTVLQTVAETLEDITADELWQGIALGLTIKQMEENQRKEE